MIKPEVSIPVALATGAVVVAIYSHMQPSAADQRVVPPTSDQAGMLAASEQNAFIVAVGVTGAISLIARDPTPFWVGGLLAVALSWSNRWARTVDPMTGTIAGLNPPANMQGRRYTVQAAG